MGHWSLIPLGKFRNQYGTCISEFFSLRDIGAEASIHQAHQSLWGGCWEKLLILPHFLLAVGTADELPEKVLWPIEVWLPGSLAAKPVGTWWYQSICWRKGICRGLYEPPRRTVNHLRAPLWWPRTVADHELTTQRKMIMGRLFSERFLLNCDFCQSDKGPLRATSRQALQVDFCGHS